METQNNFYDRFREAAAQDELQPVPHTDMLWNKVAAQLDEKKKERNVRSFFKIAAVAATVVLFIGSTWWLLRETGDPTQRQVVAGNRDNGSMQGKILHSLPKDTTSPMTTQNPNYAGGTDNVNSSPANKVFQNKKQMAQASMVTTGESPAPASLPAAANNNKEEITQADRSVAGTPDPVVSLPAASAPAEALPSTTYIESQKYASDPANTYNYYSLPQQYRFYKKAHEDFNEQALNKPFLRLEESSMTGVAGQSEQLYANDYDEQSMPGAERSSDKAAASFTHMLQGQAAGVSVTATDGAPGTSASIRIRGASSINGGLEPLYIINGVPANSDELTKIRQSDIIHMQVLKDASATAIYGSRGANGVVVVTTRKAKLRYTDGCESLFQHWFGKHKARNAKTVQSNIPLDTLTEPE